MRNLVVASLGVVAVATGHVCAAAAAFDDVIAVEGNRRIDAAAIRTHFHGGDHAIPGAGAALSPAAIDAALKELYAIGLFEDVTIARSGAGLIVTVVEAPMLERVAFEGNKQFKDKDLIAEIAVKPRGPVTRSAVAADVARLLAFYRRGGRYDATITPKTIARGDGRVDLVFEIDEGAKTGVKRVAFAGNRAFSDYRLKNVVRTTESGWFAFLKTGDVYDPDRIEADSDLLRHFYLKNGFADMRVSGAAVYDPELKDFIVTFAIDEGERYRLGPVEVVSRVAGIDAAAVRGALRLASGSVYDADAVAKAGDAIALAAAKLGAPFVTVRPRASRNPAARTVDLAFVLDDGPHAYIERIAIRGNIATRDEVIRREFDLVEGDAYNRDAIGHAERRLKALHLFKSVKTSTEPGSAPDRLVLNVDVEEDRTGNFTYSGGYSLTDGLVGEVAVSEQNFLGLGQYVKVSATVGQYLRGATAAFTEPYFLDQRLSLGFEGSYRETLNNVYQSYGSTSYGGTVKLGAPLNDEVSTQARYSLVNQGISLAPCAPATPPPGCFADSAASAAIKQAVLDGPLWISSVGSSLVYSTLDDPKNPHEGVRATFNEDVAGLGRDAKFFKNTGDVRYYQDLGSDVVAMERVQGGYIMPYGGQTLPLLSGFFGGPQLVRGFAPNGFGPRDLTPGTTMDNIGGSAYWGTSAELQAPIPALPPEIALKAAAFADAGSLWGYRGATSFPALSQSLTVGDSRQVRSSLGAGLIWDSPFGALRVDYAIPVSKAPYDVTQRLRFNAGPF